MLISKSDGDIIPDTAQEAEELIRKCSEKGTEEIWISKDAPFPALVLLICEEYACVHYFADEDGVMYMSKGCGDRRVTFTVGGTEWETPEDTVISLDDALRCMHSFCKNTKLPECIAWQDGV